MFLLKLIFPLVSSDSKQSIHKLYVPQFVNQVVLLFPLSHLLLQLFFFSLPIPTSSLFSETSLYPLGFFPIHTFIRIPFYPPSACGYEELLDSMYCWLYCFWSFALFSLVNQGKRFILSHLLVFSMNRFQTTKVQPITATSG